MLADFLSPFECDKVLRVNVKINITYNFIFCKRLTLLVMTHSSLLIVGVQIVTLSDDNTLRIWRVIRRVNKPEQGFVIGNTERTRREIGELAMGILYRKYFKVWVLTIDNEEQIISGCPIDGAISVRVDCWFGSYRWFVYIITLLLRDASWILILHCGPPEEPQRHLYC